ncbi:single-stranded DNA-binding protein [Ancylomarina sp. 16SWW S1-10-2]|uniref:single-stranded DNA-binding protein n=1 Tax=Ancylomarina sp. 16SWW S1-10-2 TaxID=2499681 RepID=UPI0012AE4704|nr:single-stranded DNA-binding protein [Ancylomarina sp. 16SWW S1-10-2]MRT91452.1 single-stranded DNA-binding protein [Ancylomarina sp. 16SWW S1-10-2]
MSVNKVILVGNVGADPDVKYLENGVAVCRLSLATNETYTRKEEKVTQTEWHRLVLWRKLAETAEKHVKKGDLLYVEGRLRSNSWEDKEGIKRYTTEIFVDSFKFIGSRGDKEVQTSNVVEKSQTQSSEANAAEDATDDLPF